MMELPGRLQPGHPGHRDVEDREVDAILERAGDGVSTVSGLGHHLQVGFGIEDHPERVADGPSWPSARSRCSPQNALLDLDERPA